MGEEDILSPDYGEDEEETTEDHEEDQRGESETEDQRHGGVNVFQSNDRNVPEQKNENQENDAGEHQ